MELNKLKSLRCRYLMRTLRRLCSHLRHSTRVHQRAQTLETFDPHPSPRLGRDRYLCTNKQSKQQVRNKTRDQCE